MADMRVTVDQTRCDVCVARIDDLSCIAARVLRSWADVADPSIENCDLNPVKYFTGVHVDELASMDDEIGLYFTEGAANEAQ